MTGTWEYEIDCDTRGKTFTVGLSVPMEAIVPESLARLIDSIHAPFCKPTSEVQP